MSKDNINDADIFTGFPQADQRGKQSLLQLKLKECIFLISIAKSSIELSWSSRVQCTAQSRNHLAFTDLTTLYYIVCRYSFIMFLNYRIYYCSMCNAACKCSPVICKCCINTLYYVLNKTQVKLLSQKKCVYKDIHVTFLYC